MFAGARSSDNVAALTPHLLVALFYASVLVLHPPTPSSQVPVKNHYGSISCVNSPTRSGFSYSTARLSSAFEVPGYRFQAWQPNS